MHHNIGLLMGLFAHLLPEDGLQELQ